MEIGYVRMDKMVADGLTKALDKTKHELFVAMLVMLLGRSLSQTCEITQANNLYCRRKLSRKTQ